MSRGVGIRSASTPSRSPSSSATPAGQTWSSSSLATTSPVRRRSAETMPDLGIGNGIRPDWHRMPQRPPGPEGHAPAKRTALGHSPGGCRATNPAGPVPTVLQRGPVGGGLGGLPSPAAVSK